MTVALLTDKYELTMLAAALRDGTAHRRTTFEVFARRLPEGRRYGVVAGTARFLEALTQYRFDPADLGLLRGFLDADTLDYLAGYRFGGDIDGYPEGELYFPGSPILSVHGTFAECVLLETLVLSIFNHDTAIASAAARMASAAQGRPLIEMGSRRTHEHAAVAAARAAYLAGFAGSSNLEAQRRYGVPALGTAAHAYTLLHTTASGPDEQAAFRGQVAALGTDTTLLVDTYDITAGVANAIAAAGPKLGAVRIDSGDLGVLARQVRAQLDDLGATETKIVVSGDLDEYAIAALRAEPVDSYGVGTSVVTGSGARPRAWSTSWSRSTACRWPNAAAARNPTAAARRRCGSRRPPAPSSKRWCTRTANRRRSNPRSPQGSSPCRWWRAANPSRGTPTTCPLRASASAPGCTACRGTASSCPAANPRSRRG